MNPQNTDFANYQPLLDDALMNPDSPLHLYHYYHTDGGEYPDVYVEENGHMVFKAMEINSFWASPKLSELKLKGVMLGISQYDQNTPIMLPSSNHLRLIPGRLVFGDPIDNSKALFIVEELFHKREKLSRIVHITLLWARREAVANLVQQYRLTEIDLENNSYLSVNMKEGMKVMNCPRNDTAMDGKYLKTWIHICHLGDLSIPKFKSNELEHRQIIEIPVVKNLTSHDFSEWNMSAPNQGVEDQSSNSDESDHEDDENLAEQNRNAVGMDISIGEADNILVENNGAAAGGNMNVEEDEDENLFAENREVAAEVNGNVEEERKESQSDRAIFVSSNPNPLVQSNPKASLSKGLRDSQASSILGSTQASTQANPQANTQLDSSQLEEEKE